MAGALEKLFQSKKDREDMDKKAEKLGMPKLSVGSYSSADIEAHMANINKGRAGVPNNGGDKKKKGK